MGKRRVRNLQALEVEEIVGYDVRADRRAETEDRYQIRTVPSFEQGMAADPYAVIVSVPAGGQLPYLEVALAAGKHCFNETNFVEDLSHLEQLSRDNQVVGVPSFTTRFNPAIRKIWEMLQAGELGEILAFQHHCGDYLPHWHPWEDYRDPYYAKRESGGAREMVAFELQWITWLLGGVTRLSCYHDKLSDLDTNIDDVYQVLVQLDSQVLGSLQIDVISPASSRVITIMGTDTIISWTHDEPIRLYQRESESWTEIPVPRGTPFEGYSAPEEQYIEEIKSFLDAATGRQDYGYTYSDYQRIVDTLSAAEREWRAS